MTDPRMALLTRLEQATGSADLNVVREALNLPNRDALLRLGTALLAEEHDEWLTMGKLYLTQASMTCLLGGIPGTTLSDLLKEGMAV